MGTNFYVRIKASEQQKQALRETFEDFIDRRSNCEFLELLEDFNKEIHLGKRSCGWQFLWNHNNGKYYDLTLDSIKEFVEANNGLVWDEYGDSYDWNTFINDEIGYCLYKIEGLHNGESYENWVLSQPLGGWITIGDKRQAKNYLSQSHTNIIKGKEYKVCCYDFTTEEGLRFSDSTEFC